jgi:hypothetical protein
VAISVFPSESEITAATRGEGGSWLRDDVLDSIPLKLRIFVRCFSDCSVQLFEHVLEREATRIRSIMRDHYHRVTIRDRTHGISSLKMGRGFTYISSGFSAHSTVT